MTVILRNTISGVAYEATDAEAEAILSHPVHSSVNRVVDTIKPEVLSLPYRIGPNGERIEAGQDFEKSEDHKETEE